VDEFLQQFDAFTDLTPILQASLHDLLISRTDVRFGQFLLTHVDTVGYIGVAATRVVEGIMLLVPVFDRDQVPVLDFLSHNGSEGGLLGKGRRVVAL
jgi:hypothetical protein